MGLFVQLDLADCALNCDGYCPFHLTLIVVLTCMYVTLCFWGPTIVYGMDLVIISPALSTALVLVRTTQGLHVYRYSTSYSAALCDALISFFISIAAYVEI